MVICEERLVCSSGNIQLVRKSFVIGKFYIICVRLALGTCAKIGVVFGLARKRVIDYWMILIGAVLSEMSTRLSMTRLIYPFGESK